jgi:hypothetical protein
VSLRTSQWPWQVASVFCFCRWHGRFILGKIRKVLLCLIRSFRSEIFEQSVCCLGLSGTKLLQTDSPFGFNLQCYSEAICFRNDCTNATWISGFFGHGKPWSPATAPAGGSDMLASRHSLSASVAKPDDFCFADPWMKFLRLIPKRTRLPTPRNQCRIHAACVKAYTVRMHVYVGISMLSSHVPSFVQHTKHMLCHVLSVNMYFTNTIYKYIYIYIYIYVCIYQYINAHIFVGSCTQQGLSARGMTQLLPYLICINWDLGLQRRCNSH